MLLYRENELHNPIFIRASSMEWVATKRFRAKHVVLTIDEISIRCTEGSELVVVELVVVLWSSKRGRECDIREL